MNPSCHKFESAVRRFEQTHASDPNGLASDYHARLAGWVEKLAPDATVALCLAAHCQHLRRWAFPRSDYPSGLAGYKRWRSTLARRHADEAGAVLRDVGYDDDTVNQVRTLLLKKGLKSDPAVQLFEDAICLTFIEGELDDFAAKHDADKMVNILAKTWKKMSPQGHALATSLLDTLDDSTKDLLERALCA